NQRGLESGHPSFARGSVPGHPPKTPHGLVVGHLSGVAGGLEVCHVAATQRTTFPGDRIHVAYRAPGSRLEGGLKDGHVPIRTPIATCAAPTWLVSDPPSRARNQT